MWRVIGKFFFLFLKKNSNFWNLYFIYFIVIYFLKAGMLGVDYFIILTDVEGVYLNYKKSN